MNKILHPGLQSADLQLRLQFMSSEAVHRRHRFNGRLGKMAHGTDDLSFIDAGVDAGVIAAPYEGIDTRFLADIIVQFCLCVPSHSDVIERSNQSAISRCRFRPIENSELGIEPDPKTHYNFG